MFMILTVLSSPGVSKPVPGGQTVEFSFNQPSHTCLEVSGNPEDLFEVIQVCSGVQADSGVFN